MEIGEGVGLETIQIEKCEEYEARTIGVEEEAILQVPGGGEVGMDSLGPCVGLVGYDKKRKIIFGFHFSLGPKVDSRVAEARLSLEQSGITITDCAVAGGNITRKSAKLHPENSQECREAKERIAASGIKSFMNNYAVMDGEPADRLCVRYENKKFNIEFVKSDLNEEI